MQFAYNLKFLMDQTGMTNYQLAKKLGCHQSNVAYWLSGERIPRKKMQLDIANIFNVSQSALMDGYVSVFLGKQQLEAPLIQSSEALDDAAADNKKSPTPEGMELIQSILEDMSVVELADVMAMCADAMRKKGETDEKT